MTKQIKFTDTFALSFGPSGKPYVADTTEPGRCISLTCFLYSKWNPWSAEEKTALRQVCASHGIDVSTVRASLAA